MHEALPEGIARDHSMSDAPDPKTTGIIAYEALLELRRTKPVYVLASHSHFVMENVYNTSYWQEHGGVLRAGSSVPPARCATRCRRLRAGRTRAHAGLRLSAGDGASARHVDAGIRFISNSRKWPETPCRPEVTRRFGPSCCVICYQRQRAGLMQADAPAGARQTFYNPVA